WAYRERVGRSVIPGRPVVLDPDRVTRIRVVSDGRVFGVGIVRASADAGDEHPCAVRADSEAAWHVAEVRGPVVSLNPQLQARLLIVGDRRVIDARSRPGAVTRHEHF